MFKKTSPKDNFGAPKVITLGSPPNVRFGSLKVINMSSHTHTLPGARGASMYTLNYVPEKSNHLGEGCV